MSALIPLPSNLVSSTTQMIAELLSDWQAFIFFVLAIAAAGFLIELLIGAFRK